MVTGGAAAPQQSSQSSDKRQKCKIKKAQVLTRSWVSVVLRECIMSERSEARLSRSLMETALHAITIMYNTVEDGKVTENNSHNFVFVFSFQPNIKKFMYK